MTQLAEPRSVHVENHRRLGRSSAGWLEELRRAAIDRFDAVGFPTDPSLEDWRYTQVAPIARTHFRLGEIDDTTESAALHARYTFASEAVSELVFVNGVYSAQLSRPGKLPRGVVVESLARAVERGDRTVERHLARYAGIETNPFVALNTGFLRDGVVLQIPRGATIEDPIHLLFLTHNASGDAIVSHPRVLVLCEDNVEATFVETYAGEGAGQYFTNGVTEIVCGADCRIDHCKIQLETLSAFHVATMQVELGRASTFVSHSITVGGRITRNDLNCVMNGDGAYATLNGLVLIGGDQHVDNHTLLHHEKPNCPSHELYKHVLDGRATGVFRGKIFVQKDAQKTDSKQNSKSLLLSDEAQMNSQPALEIYADDVKCTHGSTTGPLDEEMMYYLRTRGVGFDAARHLLTYAFAADVTRRIKVEPVRRRIEDLMAAQHGLPQDLRITDLSAFDEKVGT